MENRINVAELLKDCPLGIELNCTMYNNVTFRYILTRSCYPIQIQTPEGTMQLSKYGCMSLNKDAKCVIFPKGKTTWEGFVPPCEFKDGDIVATDNGNWIGITTGGNTHSPIPTYCVIKQNGKFEAYFDRKNKWCFSRLATEEEKAKLLQAIKDNGYHWNTETKTLEKLVEPQFNVGDWIIRNNKYTGIPVKVIEFNGYYSCELNGEVVNLTRNDVHNNFHLWTIQDAKDGDVLFHSDSASNGIFIFKEILQCGTIEKVVCHCDYDSEDGFCLGENHTCCWTDSKILYPATKKRCDLLFKKIKEAGYKWNTETKTLDKLPKFKVGDKIKRKGDTRLTTIKDIRDNCYIITIPDYFDNAYITDTLLFSNQNEYELVTNKFDITTLQPFESRVLIRDHKGAKWRPAIWGCYDNEKHIPYPYVVVGGLAFARCIPYEGNEYLCGTTDDCNDFYKTWE